MYIAEYHSVSEISTAVRQITEYILLSVRQCPEYLFLCEREDNV
jgi:hypothetical protein